MTSPTTLYSHPHTKSGGRSGRGEEDGELGKKPKKINSEVRKQQNRIASRNYREKRKRKLQYLQQLIKDGSNDEQSPDTSPQQHEAHLRPRSADYEPGPSLSPFSLSSHSDFAPMNTNSTAALGPHPTASTAPLDSHFLPTTHAYPPYEPSWNNPMYDPLPPTNMTWNVPAWTPAIDYSPRAAPRPEDFHFSPPLGVNLPIFEHTPSPYHRPRELVPNTNQYPFSGDYNGSQSQTSGIPSYFLGAHSKYLERSIYI
ncbi:hypothetical protein CC86DRAFT_378818 [Ophiobolus disseminans]|uniref:BZIP domain-containing protein n=1 Tax=Ophiobolus disseminans TaxID=1469910 RepID=A0A6A7ABC6_9PLEO|nr:hypothetical protein CC86DRAFT_378818 [Ophiobolus disseminans]